MRWLLRAMAALLLLVPLVFTTTSCPDADVLRLDTGTLTLVVQPVNPGTRYESVSLRISQVKIRPLNPDADAVIGARPLGLFRTPIAADLAQGSSQFQSVPVNSGGYRVVGLTVTGVVLRDDDPPVNPTTCLEGVVDPGPDGLFDTADDVGNLHDFRFSPPVTLPLSVEFTTFADPNFAIPSGGGMLTLNVDVAQLTAAYESGFSCFTPATPNVCPGNIPSKRCLSSFSVANYVGNAAPAFDFD